MAVLFLALIIATTRRVRTFDKLSQIVTNGLDQAKRCKALARGQLLAIGVNTGQPARDERVNLLTFGRSWAIMVMQVDLSKISLFQR